MENFDNGYKVVPENILQIIKNSTSHEDYTSLCLITQHGQTQCRFYEMPEFSKAMIFIGGIGGDWDTPSRQLYPHLCVELMDNGIASFRVRLKNPHDLDESVFDVIAVLSYLRSLNVQKIGIVGYSFGGAVAIRAASVDLNVKLVVTLATQSYGAGSADDLGPRCALLLLHGGSDTVLPESASEHIFSIAKDPKEIQIYPQATHSLDEVAEELHKRVKDWVLKWLK